MAKLRPGRAYRSMKQPYTRKSKFKEKNYTKFALHTKITQFHSGNMHNTFKKRVEVISKSTLQVRDNALEAARIVANKYLTDSIGEENFHIQLVSIPHHILREHKLATGAGADRFSAGMQKSFGKPIGLASQISAGDKVFEIFVNEDHVNEAKEAADKIKKKLGFKTLALVI
ncbi:50S ribosomal protein L16 [Candidatus Parvarchaeota archaeon]|uniref:50S ribosomal protein L16 n=1 Tax=Candidatus Acidifodinimicrobium mancum TaxID=2898728 RepID=A0A8T3UYZ6_9ARCH|nr:50S ribosomal protein L16 [Candidatus Acidifodinimicrobium mancum]MBE5728299.1 50S ribosomal protein L16 [Candidatus Acidifodinimicrobium mancum]MBE5728932.1 50S ribosomal protein L16 [Candidatus Acidifodinimicrobium mancum]MBE5729909.1 50S ribosomal protein L16 [Candidatus Acidifodinimicrobium mancum]